MSAGVVQKVGSVAKAAGSLAVAAGTVALGSATKSGQRIIAEASGPSAKSFSHNTSNVVSQVRKSALLLVVFTGCTATEYENRIY